MKFKKKASKIREFSWPWIAHFGIHLVMSIAALCSGLFIAIIEGEVLPGIALSLAAILAFVNGVNGFRELIGTKPRGSYLNDD